MMNSESGALMRRHLRIILRQSVMLLAEELTFEGQMASWVIASSKFARISFADAACSFYRPDRVIAKSLAGVRYPCSRSRAPPMENSPDLNSASTLPTEDTTDPLVVALLSQMGGETPTSRLSLLLGIVNLAARGMLVVSVARRLGSKGPLPTYCHARSNRAGPEKGALIPLS